MGNLVWNPVKIKLGQIRPWSNNPRLSTKAQAERLIQSERELGQVQTIAIGPQEPDGMYPLYDGHQRYSSWLTVKGNDYEMTALQSNRPLTEDERRKMSILLHTATGGWNWDTLAGWQTGELKEWGLVNQENIKGWQNDISNTKELLNAEQVTQDAEPEIDRAAELLEKWQVKTGDLWQIGEHRLICGDCTDAAVVARVMDGGRADIGAHDPPYGIGADKKKAHSSIRDNPAWQDPKWDERTPTKDELNFIMSLSNSVAFWGGNYFANNLPASSAWLVWIKPQAESGFSLADLELCWTNKEFSARCKTVNRRDGSLHPTQKPVDVISWTIEMLGTGQIVLDSYCGSGTTLVACQNLNRRCRAIEISPAYVAVALERMSQAFPGIDIKRI